MNSGRSGRGARKFLVVPGRNVEERTTLFPLFSSFPLHSRGLVFDDKQFTRGNILNGKERCSRYGDINVTLEFPTMLLCSMNCPCWRVWETEAGSTHSRGNQDRAAMRRASYLRKI